MAKKFGIDGAKLTGVRHGRLRRSNGWMNALRVLLTTAVVVVLSGIATVAYAVWGLTQDVTTVEMPETTSAMTVDAGEQSIDGSLTILLVGSDTRAGQSYNDGEEGELNDVTLMLHVSADHQNATVVSFPRDLMVPIPSCPGPNGEENYTSPMSEQQINSTLGVGGLPCVAATVSALTGMEIPYAGLITFDGVIGVSNALGGVEVCLTQPIVDPNTELDLPAGMNTLVGWDALQFLRTRYGVGDGGDTSRISNQQVFMSALMRQLKSADTLADPVKVYALAKAGVENMTLSSNMASVRFMQAVAGTVKDINLENINFVQYPSFSHPYQEGRLTPNYVDAQLLFDIIQSGEPFQVTAVGEGVQTEEELVAAEQAEIDPATGEPIAPVEGEPAAPVEEPQIDPETGEPIPPAEPVESGPVQLPSAITGQQANEVTCSQGRTKY